MTKISREEILKIARMSHVDVRDDEIQSLTEQLEQVLSCRDPRASCEGRLDVQTAVLPRH